MAYWARAERGLLAVTPETRLVHIEGDKESRNEQVSSQNRRKTSRAYNSRHHRDSCSNGETTLPRSSEEFVPNKRGTSVFESEPAVVLEEREDVELFAVQREEDGSEVRNARRGSSRRRRSKRRVEGFRETHLNPSRLVLPRDLMLDRMLRAERNSDELCKMLIRKRSVERFVEESEARKERKKRDPTHDAQPPVPYKSHPTKAAESKRNPESQEASWSA